MLNNNTRQSIKATIPFLKEHAAALTHHMYARMFKHNPELKAIFNQSNQVSGTQQQALAMAVVAYAEHIDDPSVLLPVLERVANKHASLGIRAEHYPVVGQHLLSSIRELAGEEVANDEMIAAWAAAYGQLADILIGMEQNLYQQATTQPGGWSGWRGFKVMKKEVESDEMTSFCLLPTDGGTVPDYIPGQYISVRVFVPQLGLYQPQQYRLSDALGAGYLKISVKRELGEEVNADRVVSNLLHHQYQVGDLIDVSAPMGSVPMG